MCLGCCEKVDENSSSAEHQEKANNPKLQYFFMRHLFSSTKTLSGLLANKARQHVFELDDPKRSYSLTHRTVRFFSPMPPTFASIVRKKLARSMHAKCWMRAHRSQMIWNKLAATIQKSLAYLKKNGPENKRRASWLLSN